jgi:NADH:ubiquinone oxidoreductase subunit 5 (subunit L)/multisubunit Na+/H+ antiporter MnhA subunit
VLLLVLGFLSAVLGSAYAFVQTDIKRLLAYSSIDNIGIVFMGLGIAAISKVNGNTTASAVAFTAALLHIFNHTLFKGSLFLGASSVEAASKTHDMNRLGGLIKTMPRTSVLLLFGALSVAALVPFNGFVSEWMTYQAAFYAIVKGQEGLNTLYLLSVAGLAMAGALAVAAYVKLFGITCLGKPRSQEAADAREVSLPMIIGAGLLTGMCLLTGLFPIAIVRIIRVVTDGLNSPLSVSPIQDAFWYEPLGFHLSGGKISPALMFFAVGAVVVVTAAILMPATKRRPIRRNVTWDCGYPKMTNAMQYSATGFSKPIIIVLRMVFRPVRKKTVTGECLYHPEGIDYSTTSDSYVESTFYRPLSRIILAATERIRFSVQTGSVRRYLAYILLLLLSLMTYNRLM